MTEVNFLKVIDVLPVNPKRDSVYFVYHTLSGTVTIHVTDYKGNPKSVGAAISQADIIAALGFLPLDSSKFVFDEVPSGIVNGSNAIFNTLSSFIPGTAVVFVNGLKQKIVQDFNTSGTTQVTFIVSPASTDQVTINYIKP